MHFSIIIPAKNEESNIGRCLDSIRKIDYDGSHYEVIVVDNGSSDRTVEIARQKGATVFVQPDLTISGLRNFGAKQAEGEILAFLDADCAVAPQWLQAASLYLTKVDSVSAFGSPVVVPEDATWVQTAWFHVRGKPEKIMPVEWLESANLFVQRKAFNEVKGFNETLVTCEDYDLTQRLKSIGMLLTDFRIKAVHYREPSTVWEFIKKEIWRGKSNYVGLFVRQIDLSEIPSLVLPLIYAVLLLAILALIVLAQFSNIQYVWAVVAIIFWQAPIVFMSIRKGMKSGVAVISQLIILFNAYFVARALGPLCK